MKRNEIDEKGPIIRKTKLRIMIIIDVSSSIDKISEKEKIIILQRKGGENIFL